MKNLQFYLMQVGLTNAALYLEPPLTLCLVTAVIYFIKTYIHGNIHINYMHAVKS